MSFPLYDSLYRETENKEKDLTPTQKNNFMKKISDVDSTGMELIYVLIRSYQNNNTGESCIVKVTTDEVYVDLERMPIRLKHMIFTFIQKHLKTMEEELKLQSISHL
jgi:hypothetical protein